MNNKESYRILADGQEMLNDTWKTGLNNNDLVIGPSGAGKTRGYVLPNILQGNESMIVVDSKNTLYEKTRGILGRKGYRLIRINISDLSDASGTGYNPLDYIRFDWKRKSYNEQDIMTISACLVPIESEKEPFWDFAGRMFLECLIAYVLECLPRQEHTLESVELLYAEMGSNIFDRLLREHGSMHPESFAYRRYKLIYGLTKADKTYACILGILAEKLSPLLTNGLKELYQKPDRVRFRDIGREKTVVFVDVSDTERSQDRLATLFFAQALHMLCDSADKDYPDHRLPVPVRLILDDFAANGCIPDLDKIISVIRSREIAVSIILQSLSQLDAIYGPARAKTIMNNCDTCLYLGGQDIETAGYVGIKANKPIGSVLNMPLEKSWLFQRGRMPRMVGKYRLESHELYPEMEKSSACVKGQQVKERTWQRGRKSPSLPPSG